MLGCPNERALFISAHFAELTGLASGRSSLSSFALGAILGRAMIEAAVGFYRLLSRGRAIRFGKIDCTCVWIAGLRCYRLID